MKTWLVLLAPMALACHRHNEAPPADSTRATTAGATNVAGPGAGKRIGAADSARDSAASRSSRPAGAAAPASPAASAGPAAPRSAAEDTVRGIAAVVGTDRFNQVILKPAGGGKGVTLVGSQAPLVASVSGADVWASGTRLADGKLQVSRFVVRAVDGAAATDGTLERQGEQFFIVTADGRRHPINNVPEALRAHVGARVWATGALDRGPASFGFIAAAAP